MNISIVDVEILKITLELTFPYPQFVLTFIHESRVISPICLIADMSFLCMSTRNQYLIPMKMKNEKYMPKIGVFIHEIHA